jgi:predicted enzyme related to lactoylglutathione lyase
MTPHGMIHWTELNTHDLDKARDFYGKTLGWTFDTMPMPDGSPYLICMAGDEMVGGMSKITDPRFKEAPEFWMTYFSIDDIDARLENAHDNGATVLMGPFDVPNVGRIAVVQSPSGSVAGWMTPADAA